MSQMLDWTNKIRLSLKEVPLTLTMSEREKLVFHGPLSAEFPKGSYKYGRECVLTVWSVTYPTVQVRAYNNGFARLEIPIPVSSALRDFFLAVAFEIDRQLKGV